jgi:hypothetical protein
MCDRDAFLSCPARAASPGLQPGLFLLPAVRENGPAQVNGGTESEQSAGEPTDTDGDGDWIAVLGISAQESINEVKDAYRILIKKNHPDRVQDMSPVFRMLAEAETKKDQGGLSPGVGER